MRRRTRTRTDLENYYTNIYALSNRSSITVLCNESVLTFSLLSLRFSLSLSLISHSRFLKSEWASFSMCAQAVLVCVCVYDVSNDLVGFIGDLLWLVIAAKSKFSCLNVWFFVLFTFFFGFVQFFFFFFFGKSCLVIRQCNFLYSAYFASLFFFSLHLQNEYLQLSTNRCHKCSKKAKQMFFTIEKFEWQMAIHTYTDTHTV